MKHTQKSYSFIIANDNVSDLHMYTSIVTKSEHRILGLARDGYELLELAEKHKPDVILSDLVMPNMSGIDACTKIKKNNPTIPCIIVSAFAEMSDVYKSAYLQLNGFIFLPFTVHKLNICLNHIAENKRYIDLTYRRDFLTSLKEIQGELKSLRNQPELSKLWELAELTELSEVNDPNEHNKDAAEYDVFTHNGKQIKINHRHILLVSAIYHSLERNKIADKLNITEQTVDTTVKRLKQSLSVDDRIQLIRLFHDWGYLRDTDLERTLK
jgi:DNA-binding NarL/FixJ family response regulator